MAAYALAFKRSSPVPPISSGYRNAMVGLSPISELFRDINANRRRAIPLSKSLRYQSRHRIVRTADNKTTAFFSLYRRVIILGFCGLCGADGFLADCAT